MTTEKNYYAEIEHLESQGFREDCRNEIESWDWQGIVDNALSDNPISDGMNDTPYYATFIGTVFAIMPSGKYYTPWACSNVDMEEAARDEIFREELESVAEEHGGWIESGEGDPCDLFFGICKE
jgi:hypothetical protein